MTKITLTIVLADDIPEDEQEDVYGALLAQVEDYIIQDHSVSFTDISDDEEDLTEEDDIQECPF